jgi:hypothetical protein
VGFRHLVFQFGCQLVHIPASLLGDGDMVDPDARHFWRMAARYRRLPLRYPGSWAASRKNPEAWEFFPLRSDRGEKIIGITAARNLHNATPCKRIDCS